MNIFEDALLLKSKSFEKKRERAIAYWLPGTCGNGNDNFRIFTLNHIFPRGVQRWKIFLEHIQLCFNQCPCFLLFFLQKREAFLDLIRRANAWPYFLQRTQIWKRRANDDGRAWDQRWSLECFVFCVRNKAFFLIIIGFIKEQSIVLQLNFDMAFLKRNTCTYWETCQIFISVAESFWQRRRRRCL